MAGLSSGTEAAAIDQGEMFLEFRVFSAENLRLGPWKGTS
jgi:hypothetical protein